MTAVDPLVILLELSQRARQAATPDELRFVMVNETHGLVPYRQAVLWDGRGKVTALSGIPLPDAQAPFVAWLHRLFHHHSHMAPTDRPSVVTGPLAPPGVREEWPEWLPEQALLLPMRLDERVLGWLLLARESPFAAAEGELLHHLAGVYAHAWSCRARRQERAWRQGVFSGWKKGALVAMTVALLFWRVPLTTLAPAEIVPIRPEVVRAPMDGVVMRFHVQPNEVIQTGQPLFDLDDTTLKSRLEVAEKGLAIAESEYLVTSQLALQDPRSKAQLAILSGRVEEKRLEAEGLRELLTRSRVKASRSGIALFSDLQNWIGRPVITGERILTVADAGAVEIEAWLSPGDLIPLAENAETTLYLNVDPLHPRTARLRLLAYEATARPDGGVAHQLRATLTDASAPPRLGLKGIARLQGERVPLWWWMTRRPMALVRQWLG
ncbi:MAG: HlyD family efflux transporter periplasmic adaptor subunit [Magnetococcales bacterium]|nr:HlyD family efflux transporter periplasmic adaptor subunit [Magnetococcales bacterium]